VLRDVDQVLVMSVNPGFGGQKLIASALEKITALRRLLDDRGWPAEIEIDGGIKIDNIDAAVKAGANVIVSGSGIFGTKDYAATIAELRRRGEAARG
jgi:ribulose-phosphate 3-epimerase